MVPGAQQLELLRRLNAVGTPDPALVDRVLAASAPGRGRPDLELVGADSGSRFGPAPVDPGALPDDELVRVATLLLAEDLVAADTGEGSGDPGTDDSVARVVGDTGSRLARWARWRPGRTQYRLVGDPWVADGVRTQLERRGHPAGGRGAVVLVLASDLATLLAHRWTDLSFRTGASPAPWTTWLETQAGRRAGGALDVSVAADRWVQRVGPDRVRVVTDLDLLPGLLRTGPVAAPALPAVHATELARRVSAALALLVLPDRGRRLLRGVLLPRLLEEPGAALSIPPEHHRWVARRSRRIREEVSRRGYPVVGDPDVLVDRPRLLAAATPGLPESGPVLDLAVRLLLEHGSTHGSRGRGDGR